MKAKPHHVKTGRVLYSVEAFPSSVPGRTQAKIITLLVTDRARAPRWSHYECDPKRFPCAPRNPIARFSCLEKRPDPIDKWHIGIGGRFLSDMNIGKINPTTCRRVFIKRKAAEAYAARIMSGCWNAQEIAYVKRNDEYKLFIGHN